MEAPMQSQVPQSVSWQQDGYILTTDPLSIDRKLVHQFLSENSYWALNIPRDIVDRSLDHSLCFGLLEADQHMVGFARVVSDYATFANLMDVFILPSFRGQGLSKWMMTCIFAHPDLQNLRSWSLRTRDAHGLYSQFGFHLAKHPEKIMEKISLNPYGQD